MVVVTFVTSISIICKNELKERRNRFTGAGVSEKTFRWITNLGTKKNAVKKDEGNSSLKLECNSDSINKLRESWG